MYFLLKVCENPHVLRTLYFGIIIKDIVFTIIPIGIIVMTLIDFSKAVVASKEDEQQKAVKLIPKRIMYAIIVFAIPWIVGALMKVLEGAKLSVAMDYTTCLFNARNAEGNFKYYDDLLEAEEKVESYQAPANNDTDGSSGQDNSSNVNNATADRYLALVRGELNNNYVKYGGSSTSHWCALFVSYTLRNTKLDNGTSIWDYLKSKGSVGGGGHASSMWPAFKAINGWHKSRAYGGNYTPKPGDIIWFQWDYKAGKDRCRVTHKNSWKNNNGLWDGVTQCSDHIGVVEYIEGNTVHTIEGNYGGGSPSQTKVSRASYNINSNNIVVYGAWY